MYTRYTPYLYFPDSVAICYFLLYKVVGTYPYNEGYGFGYEVLISQK